MGILILSAVELLEDFVEVQVFTLIYLQIFLSYYNNKWNHIFTKTYLMFIFFLENTTRTKEKLQSAVTSPWAESRGGLCGSAFPGHRGTLCRLLHQQATESIPYQVDDAILSPTNIIMGRFEPLHASIETRRFHLISLVCDSKCNIYMGDKHYW